MGPMTVKLRACAKLLLSHPLTVERPHPVTIAPARLVAPPGP